MCVKKVSAGLSFSLYGGSFLRSITTNKRGKDNVFCIVSPRTVQHSICTSVRFDRGSRERYPGPAAEQLCKFRDHFPLGSYKFGKPDSGDEDKFFCCAKSKCSIPATFKDKRVRG